MKVIKIEAETLAGEVILYLTVEHDGDRQRFRFRLSRTQAFEASYALIDQARVITDAEPHPLLKVVEDELRAEFEETTP